MSQPLQRLTAVAPAQMMCCYMPSASTIHCEGRTVTAPDPVAELCTVLLKAGFQSDTGLVIRTHESGPIIQTVPAIGEEPPKMTEAQATAIRIIADVASPGSGGRIGEHHASVIMATLDRAGLVIEPKPVEEPKVSPKGNK